MRLRVTLFTALATLIVASLVWAVEPYNTSGRWACWSGTCIIGDSAAPAIQLLTDGTGDGEVDVPDDSISTDELTTPLYASFNICGEATTVNNNTIYYPKMPPAASCLI